MIDGKAYSKFRLKMIGLWLFSLLLPFIILFIITFSHYGNGFAKMLKGEIDIWQLNGYMTTEQIARDINIWTMGTPKFQDHDELNELLASYMEDRNPFKIFMIERQGDSFAPFMPMSDDLTRELAEKFKDLDASQLPVFGSRDLVSNQTLLEKTGYVMYKHVDFTYEDGSHGSVYFFLKYTDVPAAIMTFVRNNLIKIVLVFLAAHTLMSYTIAKRLSKPMTELMTALDAYGKEDFSPRLSAKVKEPLLRHVNGAINRMAMALSAAKQKSLDLEKLRTEFIAKIAHDTKTPLASIRAHAEALRDGVIHDEEKREKYASNILKKTMAIDAMLNELSLFSDLYHNQAPYLFSQVDLHHYLCDTLEEMAYDYDAHDLKIIYQGYEGKAKVKLDVDRMNRVITNIVKNSVKYGGTSPTELTVSVTETPKGHLQVSFKDKGMGCEGDNLDHLFESFTRGDASRNPNVTGSGLGLAIAKTIVEKHGGHINANSKVGEYFEVVITLDPLGGDHEEDSHR